MSKRPGALILDYTGVITTPLPMGRSERHGPDDGQAGGSSVRSSMDTLREMMAHELHNSDPNGLWNRLERGELPVTHLVERIDEVVPGAGVFFSGDNPATLMATLQVRADVVDRIRGWSELGVPLALLTNNIAEWRPHWTSNLIAAGGFSLFDVVIDSSEVGMRKPEERIYRHTIDALNRRLGLQLDVADCLFVDDFEQNVVAAHSIGMRAVLATHDDAHWDAVHQLLDVGRAVG